MILVRAPLRISFCGGGTDIPAYYEKSGWGAAFGMAINKYVYVALKELPDLFPYRYKLGYSITELCNTADEIKHPIIKAVVQKYNLKSLDMASFADIPAGTGLGSSSAFTVALLEAVHTLLGTKKSQMDIANEACHIEIDILKEPIGKQDQFFSALGGYNLLIFKSQGTAAIEKYPLLAPANLLLFYVGGSRSASQILTDITINKDTHLNKMKDFAIAVCDAPNLVTLGSIMTLNWDHKKQLSPQVSNEKIDSLIASALSMGAYGAKLLGAGGTGFILTVAEPYKHATIAKALGLKEIEFNVDYEGVKVLNEN